MFVILSFCIYYLLKNHQNVSDIPSILSIVLIIFILLLTIPIAGLTSFHLMLIIRGRTTNEQVTGKFKSNINPVFISTLLKILFSYFLFLVWLWIFI